MRPIPPATLTRNLTNTEQRAVTQWWRGLDRPARRALRVLVDERATAAPRGAVGRRVYPREAHVPTDAFPESDLYEYIVNHEHRLVFWEGRRRSSEKQAKTRELAMRAPPIPKSRSASPLPTPVGI